jgi:hypothetical protein
VRRRHAAGFVRRPQRTECGLPEATDRMSQGCLTSGFEREFLVRYATVHIKLNLKLRPTACAQIDILVRLNNQTPKASCP